MFIHFLYINGNIFLGVNRHPRLGSGIRVYLFVYLFTNTTEKKLEATVRFISTSTVANESEILVELTLLKTSDSSFQRR